MLDINEYVNRIKNSHLHKCFYHFTDAANLDSIQTHGLLSTEQRRIMDIEPSYRGGNSISHHADRKKGIEDYVFLSFTNEHPLHYLAKDDGRLPDLVWLKICPKILLMNDVKYADSVANRNDAMLIPIADAIGKIDEEVIYQTTNWNDSAIKDRLKRAKKCEILIPRCVPVEMIIGYQNG